MRLSTRSLAGMARTLVAVGTVRLTAMFAAARAAAPRSRTCVAPPASPSPFTGAGAAGGTGAAGAWATPDGGGGPGRADTGGADTGGADAGAAPDPGGA